MTDLSAEEKRALSQDEQELSMTARQPGLGELSDSALSDLISRLRDRRDRARDIGNRQRREARGKAAPSGSTPARGNEGTKSKQDYLSAALRRAMAEHKKRAGGGSSQADLARKALAMKEKADAADGRESMKEDGGPLHPQDPDADRGMKQMSETERRKAPSGAFEHAGERPSRMRSTTRY